VHQTAENRRSCRYNPTGLIRGDKKKSTTPVSFEKAPAFFTPPLTLDQFNNQKSLCEVGIHLEGTFVRGSFMKD
jgi:hypothetical protein